MNATCATCLHSIVPADKMGGMGWLTCMLAERYTYFAPDSLCRWSSPVRWQPKAGDMEEDNA